MYCKLFFSLLLVSLLLPVGFCHAQTFAYLGSPTPSTADLTTYTFSSQSLGDAAGDRHIIVGVHSRSGSNHTVSSVTVQGIAGTIVAQQSNNTSSSSTAAIAIVAVPTGTTGDVVVTLSTGAVRCGVSLWRATGLASTTPVDVDSSTASNPTATLDTGDGFAVGVANQFGTITFSWTGLTEDLDVQVESNTTFSSASATTTEGTLAITATPSAAGNAVGVFASWAPENLEGDWNGYISATIPAPAASLTNFPLVVSIPSSATDLWAVVQVDGDDLRAEIDGTQAAIDLIEFDAGTDTAILAVKRAGAQGSSGTLRIYAGNDAATKPGDGDTYGRNATYASRRAFWANGTLTDRTGNDNDLTLSGSPTVVDGPLTGSKAFELNGSSQYGITTVSVPTAAPLYFSAMAYPANITANMTALSINNSADIANYFGLAWAGGQGGDPVQNYVAGTGGGLSAFTSLPGFSANVWSHGAAQFASATDRKVWMNGGQQATSVTSRIPVGVNRVTLGAFGASTISGHFAGRLAFVALDTTARSIEWAAYEHAMYADPDQSDFLGSWTWTTNASPGINPAILSDIIQ